MAKKSRLIGILGYGMGNLASVKAGLTKAGAKNVKIVRCGSEIADCDALVIPGVGAFGAAMKRIRPVGKQIEEFAACGKPLLGICLGMQVLFDEGDEGGKIKGLGLLGGRVSILKNAPKLPQIGWNTEKCGNSVLWGGLPKKPWFYFVHSYACYPSENKVIIGTTRYGCADFASAVQKGNVFGVQFHPEKSGKTGQIVLKNFVQLVQNGNNSGN